MANVEHAAMLIAFCDLRPLILEIECAGSLTDLFATDYGNWTGEDVCWSDIEDGNYAFDCGQGKWGRECRIYFPYNDSAKNQITRYGFRVDDGSVRHSNTYRINSLDLFTALVRDHGFRLGENL